MKHVNEGQVKSFAKFDKFKSDQLLMTISNFHFDFSAKQFSRNENLASEVGAF